MVVDMLTAFLGVLSATLSLWEAAAKRRKGEPQRSHGADDGRGHDEPDVSE
ncbi:hypothetical protein [Actinomadura sp. 3N407]|uniref:hypothetical protein n=1 Tax=Actinomadura sp. 3N407 TaxID=3457423 RepID=UPI003FCD7F31